MKKAITAVVVIMIVLACAFIGYWFFWPKNCSQYSGAFSWKWAERIDNCENAGCDAKIKSCAQAGISKTVGIPDTNACYLDCVPKEATNKNINRDQGNHL